MSRFLLLMTAFMLCLSIPVFGQENSPPLDNQTVVEQCHFNALNYLELNADRSQKQRQEFEDWMAEKIAAQSSVSSAKTNAVRNIPVIFHIVHNNSAENLNKFLIEAQLNKLNNNFRKKAGTEGDGNGVDTEIQFYFATHDPQGNLLPEAGIDRLPGSNFSPTSPYLTGDLSSIQSASIWNANDYCNVWVLNVINDDSSDLDGAANFPGSTLPGSNSPGFSLNDGVIINYKTVGSSKRTLTHEMGHFFGLLHPWHGNSCFGDNDFCDDTPRQQTPSGGCTPVLSSCGVPHQVENYMDYSNGPCQNMFTADQKARMQVVANNSPRRSTLGTTTGVGSNCQFTLTNFPVNERFEGLTAWNYNAGGDISWTTISGSTPSGNTGPLGAFEGNKYIYVEATGNTNKTAIMESPCYNLVTLSSPVLSFAYHMNGSQMGSLVVEVSTNSGSSWSTFWSQSGNQGSAWKEVNLSLSSYAGQTVILRFQGTVGSGYRSDIAVDNVRIGDPEIPANCNTVVSSFPYEISFESDLDDWEQSGDDDLDWDRWHNQTPSTGTGPTSWGDKAIYIYLESSGPNIPRNGILTSPCYDLRGETGAEFEFMYNMYGSHMGSLELLASSDFGNTWNQIWSQSGNQGQNWINTTVNLNNYTGGYLQLRFEGLTGAGYQSDMALDHFRLRTFNILCLTVEIQSDNKGSETGWYIQDENGNIVATESYLTSNQLQTWDVCFPGDCFQFSISDSGNDGICCGSGNGYFKVYDTNNPQNIYDSGGSFTWTDGGYFCTSQKDGGTAALIQESNDPQLTLYPNPSTGTFHTSMEDAEDEFYPAQLMDLSGRIVWKGEIPAYEQTHDLSQLPQGLYLLQVRISEAKTITQKVSITR